MDRADGLLRKHRACTEGISKSLRHGGGGDSDGVAWTLTLHEERMSGFVEACPRLLTRDLGR